jgi:hypothetical protein
MTPAERRRKRRKGLAKVKSAAVTKALHRMHRQKAAALFIPRPPGITYWTWHNVRLEDGSVKKILEPVTKPLAACSTHLDDDDVLAGILSP